MGDNVPDYVPPLPDDYDSSVDLVNERPPRTPSQIAFLAKDFGPDMPPYKPVTTKPNPKRRRPDSHTLHVIHLDPDSDLVISAQKFAPGNSINLTSRRTRYLIAGVLVSLAAAGAGVYAYCSN